MPAAYPPNLTIANAATTSNSIDLGGASLLGVYAPTGLTAITSLTFEASPDNINWFSVRDLTDPASAYSRTVAATRFVPTDPAIFKGVRYLRIVGNAAATAQRVFIPAVEYI